MEIVDFNISLEEYQRSKGIKVSDQIYILENDGFCVDYFDWLEEKKKYYGGFFKKHLKVFADMRFRKKVTRHRAIFLGKKEKSYDKLNNLEEIYKKIGEIKTSKYILMIGKGDYEFTHDLLLGKPDNLVGIAANNINLDHSEVCYLPMGRDFRSKELFEKFGPTEDKPLICYCNFSLNTHPVRKTVYQSIKNKDFVTFEHMGDFLNYSISRTEFFEKLSSSKFCLCPRGNAFDTFRMWDCLYVGTIPIVVKEAKFHNQIADLPILFLESYDQYGEISKSYLEEQFDIMIKKKYNFQKLKLSYWQLQLESKLAH